MATLLAAVTKGLLGDVSRGGKVKGHSKGKRKSGKKSYGFEEAAKLEHVKLAILKQMSTDRELLQKTQDKITQYRSEAEQLHAALASTSAMFLAGKDKERAKVLMKDKDGRDVAKTVVVKPLGTREAVTETQRIIQRRLGKLRQEFEVVEVKLNRQRNANAAWKHQINTMRREACVFDGLFDQMCDELKRLKAKTESVKSSIASTYGARDTCRTEAQWVLDNMQRERTVAQEEFDLQTQALLDADAVVERKARVWSEALTLKEETVLKNSVVDTAWKIQEHKARLAQAKAKAAAFEEAIEQIKDATGYESLDELIVQMTACEEEKFEKAQAAARLIAEVETLETEIVTLRDEYRDKQTNNAAHIKASTAEVVELQEQADSVQKTLQVEARALELARSEIAAVMPMVSDLFYAAGCHTVFDKAFIPASSIKQRSFIVGRTRDTRRDTAVSQFLGTLPTIDHDDIDDDDDDDDDDKGDDAIWTGGGTSTMCDSPARREAKRAEEAAASPSGSTEQIASFRRKSIAISNKASLEGPDKAGDDVETMALRRPSLDQPAQSHASKKSIYAGDDSPCQTVSSRRSLAMRMFSRIPAFRHVIDEGVNQHTLNTFMSVLDQKTAELVQFFVYLLHRGEVSITPVVVGDAPTIASTSPAARAASIMGRAKQLTAQAIVGPDAPSGIVAKSLTSSALLASLLSTDLASSATAPLDPDDADRPLSLAEIRAQAGASLKSAEFSAFRKASQEAALELDRHTKRERKPTKTRLTSSTDE